MKNKLNILAIFLVSIILFIGCNQSGVNSSEMSSKNDSKTDENNTETDFNMQDKDAINSGNISIACNKIGYLKPEDVLKNVASSSISKITKSPYAHIGKFVKLFGNVYKVEELPPDATRPGTWIEALLLVDNSNSPLGSTTVDFIFNGDINKINANTNSTIAGYYVGNYSSTNSLGGEVEGIVVVGNYCSKGSR